MGRLLLGKINAEFFKLNNDRRTTPFNNKSMKKFTTLFQILATFALINTGCSDANKPHNSASTNESSGKAKLIKEEIITDDSPMALSPKKVIKYNENGKITDEYYYDKGDVLKSHNQYTYNELGSVIELKRIYPTPEYNSKVVYTYDSSNKLLKEINYDRNNIVSSETTCTYDSDGNILKKEFTNSFTYKYEYIYDENKKLKSIVYFNDDGSKDTEKPKENGRYQNDKNNTYKYDDKNNLIEETHNASYGFSKFTTEYDYNEKGEWLKKRTFYSESPSEKGTLRNTEIKEITYYP
jgi:hypothetical protein